MTRKTIRIAAFLLCLFCMGTHLIAHADDRKDDAPTGTSPAEVAALKARPLPQPHDLKIAIMPFWDTSGLKDNSRMETSAVWLLCQREGFQLTPILDSFKAVANDGDIEPGLPLRKDDAIRIGRKLGAHWVIYGEIRDLKQYKKESFFRNSKYVRASMRIAVAEIPAIKTASGDILYWQLRSERRGGTGIFHGQTKSGDTLKRTACIAVSYDILKPLFDAFPAHEQDKKEIESGDLADFVNATWPPDDHKDK